MVKLFNKVFNILKVLMLVISFLATMYILIMMYVRLEKEPFGKDFMEFIGVILPYILLLIVFVINTVGKQKAVNESIFFNASAVTCFSAILLFCCRAFLDKNMVLWTAAGYDINFHYFADQVTQIKVMLYMILVIDIMLMLYGKLTKKKELVLE